MTARPGTFPDWATNTNFSTGPDTGTPTKVSVPAGRRADGWVKDISPPPQYQNFWQNEAGIWVHYLDERIQRSVRSAQTPTLVNTSSTSLVDLATFPTDDVLDVGDWVVGRFTVWANCLATYKVDIYVSENGGGNIAKTPEVRHAVSASGSDFDPISLDYFHQVTAQGILTLKLRGKTDNGANQLSVYYTHLLIARRQ